LRQYTAAPAHFGALRRWWTCWWASRPRSECSARRTLARSQRVGGAAAAAVRHSRGGPRPPLTRVSPHTTAYDSLSHA
jgi:hypothetical protein